VDLSLLRQCAGIEKKISNLTSSSELFEKTVYEMRVAAAFLEDGHVVEFVETASEEGRQTPDLLVDDAVEVECTKKDAFTKRDTRNIENWQLITRRIGGIMNNAGANYGVMIKTQKDPDNKDVNFILVKSRELITTHKEGPFAYPERGIGITVRPLSKQDEQIKANSIQIGASEDTDFFVLDFDQMVNDSGSALIKNPKIFGFKCAEIPDRLKSVVESIKKKPKQLSGKRPGAIYVELNALDSHMVDVDFNRLDSLSKEVLRNNRTISAIAITASRSTSARIGPLLQKRLTKLWKDCPSCPESNFESCVCAPSYPHNIPQSNLTCLNSAMSLVSLRDCRLVQLGQVRPEAEG
jgi:hypothetical protein